MSRLLLDQGIPQSAAAHLRAQGFDAVHVQSLGMSRSPDRLILERARAERWTVVTLDADFHALLAVGNESSSSVIRIRREQRWGHKDGVRSILMHFHDLIKYAK